MRPPRPAPDRSGGDRRCPPSFPRAGRSRCTSLRGQRPIECPCRRAGTDREVRLEVDADRRLSSSALGRWREVLDKPHGLADLESLAASSLATPADKPEPITSQVPQDKPRAAPVDPQAERFEFEPPSGDDSVTESAIDFDTPSFESTPFDELPARVDVARPRLMAAVPDEFAEVESFAPSARAATTAKWAWKSPMIWRPILPRASGSNRAALPTRAAPRQVSSADLPAMQSLAAPGWRSVTTFLPGSIRRETSCTFPCQV